MKKTENHFVVLVTAPNMKIARKLAAVALSEKLIACANLVSKVESHYWWKGKIESGTEILMILKTQKSRLKALESLILARHPYENPEFLAVPVSRGSQKYLAWLADASNCG
jgi:periplasmic divalent cation tolerance protein